MRPQWWAGGAKGGVAIRPMARDGGGYGDGCARLRQVQLGARPQHSDLKVEVPCHADEAWGGELARNGLIL
jgi:hypothetical protein